MVKREPKFRKQLSEKQIRILKLIFKFRFVSSSLLAGVLGKSHSSVFESLKVLVDQEYLVKRYDGTFRLRHIPAIYSLDKKAIRLLREEENAIFSENSLRNMYKNKHMDMDYINKCLQLMEVHLALKRRYSDIFEIFTKFELSAFEQFPNPRPDLYMRRSKPKDDLVNEFMLSILETKVPYFVHIKLLRRYQTHEEDEGWEGDYPCVLLVVPTEKIEKKLLNTIEGTIQDFDFHTVTTERLIEANDNPIVWADAFNENVYISLVSPPQAE